MRLINAFLSLKKGDRPVEVICLRLFASLEYPINVGGRLSSESDDVAILLNRRASSIMPFGEFCSQIDASTSGTVSDPHVFYALNLELCVAL